MLASDSPVKAYMSTPVAAVLASATVAEAHQILSERGISSLAVTDPEGRPVGLISRSDLLRIGSLRPERDSQPLLILPEVPVSWAMSHHLHVVAPEDPLRAASEQMVEAHVHRVLVVQDDLLTGVLTTLDLARALRDAGCAAPAAAFMSAPVRTVDALAPLSVAVARLAEDRVTGLVVVEDGKPAGLFSQLEALLSKDQPADTPVGDVMGRSFACLPTDAPLSRAARSMIENRVRRVLLIEESRIQGILTGIDLARAILAGE